MRIRYNVILNQKDTYMNNLLQEGEVFNLTKGMKAYVAIPERFLCSTRNLSDKTTTTDVTIGQKYNTRTKEIENEIQDLVKQTSESAPRLSTDVLYKLIRKAYKGRLRGESFDSSQFMGEYAVIHTENSGGGKQASMGGGAPDVYPDGHKVKAKKLAADGSFDPDGTEITFYQTGAFTAMNKDVPVIRSMQKNAA